MSCLAYVFNVIVEGQSVANCHTETLYCSCNRNSDAGDCDVVDLWFRPLSGSGTNDDRFGFVWIQTKPVGLLLPMSRVAWSVCSTHDLLYKNDLTDCDW